MRTNPQSLACSGKRYVRENKGRPDKAEGKVMGYLREPSAAARQDRIATRYMRATRIVPYCFWFVRRRRGFGHVLGACMSACLDTVARGDKLCIRAGPGVAKCSATVEKCFYSSIARLYGKTAGDGFTNRENGAWVSGLWAHTLQRYCSRPFIPGQNDCLVHSVGLGHIGLCVLHLPLWWHVSISLSSSYLATHSLLPQEIPGSTSFNGAVMRSIGVFLGTLNYVAAVAILPNVESAEKCKNITFTVQASATHIIVDEPSKAELSSPANLNAYLQSLPITILNGLPGNRSGTFDLAAVYCVPSLMAKNTTTQLQSPSNFNENPPLQILVHGSTCMSFDLSILSTLPFPSQKASC